MSTITIQDLEQNPSNFIQRIEAGEPFVVMRDDHPVAEVKPIRDVEMTQRPYGLCAGEFEAPDDFDRPLPDEILNQFYGQ